MWVCVCLTESAQCFRSFAIFIVSRAPPHLHMRVTLCPLITVITHRVASDDRQITHTRRWWMCLDPGAKKLNKSLHLLYPSYCHLVLTSQLPAHWTCPQHAAEPFYLSRMWFPNDKCRGDIKRRCESWLQWLTQHDQICWTTGFLQGLFNAPLIPNRMQLNTSFTLKVAKDWMSQKYLLFRSWFSCSICRTAVNKKHLGLRNVLSSSGMLSNLFLEDTDLWTESL